MQAPQPARSTRPDGPASSDASGLRLLAVHAHPDDESSKGAASMARYAAEGARVRVLTCTGGERGSVLNPRLEGDEQVAANLPALRRREMERAAEILGVEHEWLGFPDSGLPQGDPRPPLPDGCFALVPLDEPTERMVRTIRSFRPHVMTTYDPSGGYPHPDHIRCHEVSVAAFAAAADPDRFPEAGPGWRVPKLYYNGGFRRARVRQMHEAMLARGIESPFGEMLEWMAKQPERPATPAPTTFVDCAEYFPLRDRALLAHETQIDPEGNWFKVPMALQQELTPSEDYVLVESTVETTLPENDVFAGLRDRASRPD